jgi:hypothetical protein
MNDLRLRFLRIVASRIQRELDGQDRDGAPAGRRRQLERLAARTAQRVADAEAQTPYGRSRGAS